tara:strand:- start:1205 stop:1399 length:195 start_codon:yes stop_codon:yes gene_type:complete
MSNKNKKKYKKPLLIIIVGIILLLICYWIFNICNKNTGEYDYIGKSCFEKIKEVVTGNYRLDRN